MFYSYDPQDTFKFHDTEEAAKQAFIDARDAAYDALADGFSEDNEHQISWGRVCQHISSKDRELTADEKEANPEWGFIRELEIVSVANKLLSDSPEF